MRQSGFFGCSVFFCIGFGCQKVGAICQQKRKNRPFDARNETGRIKTWRVGKMCAMIVSGSLQAGIEIETNGNR